MKKERPDEVECCNTCKHLLHYPKNNSYGDVEHLCVVTGYFVSGIYKDRNKLESHTPGGRKLECRYEKRQSDR